MIQNVAMIPYLQCLLYLVLLLLLLSLGSAAPLFFPLPGKHKGGDCLVIINIAYIKGVRRRPDPSENWWNFLIYRFFSWVDNSKNIVSQTTKWTESPNLAFKTISKPFNELYHLASHWNQSPNLLMNSIPKPLIKLNHQASHWNQSPNLSLKSINKPLNEVNQQAS